MVTYGISCFTYIEIDLLFAIIEKFISNSYEPQ